MRVLKRFLEQFSLDPRYKEECEKWIVTSRNIGGTYNGKTYARP